MRNQKGTFSNFLGQKSTFSKSRIPEKRLFQIGENEKGPTADWMRSGLFGLGQCGNPLGSQATGDSLDELAGGKSHRVRQRRDAGEVAGHLAGLDGGQGRRFQAVGESDQLGQTGKNV